jgi:hypothetical protein
MRGLEKLFKSAKILMMPSSTNQINAPRTNLLLDGYSLGAFIWLRRMK